MKAGIKALSEENHNAAYASPGIWSMLSVLIFHDYCSKEEKFLAYFVEFYSDQTLFSR